MALAAGCAELPSSDKGLLQAMVHHWNTDKVEDTSVAQEPPGKLLPPVEETAVIARLGFSQVAPDERNRTLPSTVPEVQLPLPRVIVPQAPVTPPKLNSPVAPKRQGQPLSQPVVLEPLDEPPYPHGDMSRVVPLNLVKVLEWTKARNVNDESRLEASITYVDLLSARAAHAVAIQAESQLIDLLKKVADEEQPSTAAAVEASRLQAELSGQQVSIRKAREDAVSASARLVYLLGLDPASAVSTMDRELTAFTLVNADAPVESLIAQAIERGPLMKEVETQTPLSGGGCQLADQCCCRQRFCSWHLLNSACLCQPACVPPAEEAHSQTSLQDMRARLTMRVQESREAALSARDRLTLALNQVKHANEAYEQSVYRLTESPYANNRSPTEVHLAMRSLQEAKTAYLTAIRDHDKAQLRLAFLTGAAPQP
jgi:hypothetical protein